MPHSQLLEYICDQPRPGRPGFSLPAHSSRFSFRFPQCKSLRSVNTRSTLRFKARNTPMRECITKLGGQDVNVPMLQSAQTTDGDFNLIYCVPYCEYSRSA